MRITLVALSKVQEVGSIYSIASENKHADRHQELTMFCKLLLRLAPCLVVPGLTHSKAATSSKFYP